MLRISLRTCCCYDICHDSSPFKRISQKNDENITNNVLLLWCLSWQFPFKRIFSNNDENITKNLLLSWYLSWQFPLNKIFQTMMRISLRTCYVVMIFDMTIPLLREFLFQTMMRISLRTCCCYDICHDRFPF